MKTKDYKFVVVVKKALSRYSAEMRLLAIFASRYPDGFEFHLRKFRKK